nr:ABC-three component system protein [Geodermatophilus amargosae]
MDVRDAVPEGTFERLQDDIHAGVIETVESEHASGMLRLTAALNHATLLDLSAHPLVSLARPDDRKGICHQLANDHKIAWTSGATT